MPAVPDLPQAEIAIVEMTNAFRKDHGLRALKPNARLTEAARSYAVFLALTNKFSHTADGRRAGDRATSAGYKGCAIAENLASFFDSRGFRTRQLARQTVDGWIKSPGHRKNMLLPHMTEIGVGITKVTGRHEYVSVQLFGRPQSLRYSFQIHNRSNVTVTFSFAARTRRVKPRFDYKLEACNPATLTIAIPGRPKATYEARDGQTYVLKPGVSGRIGVEILPPPQRPTKKPTNTVTR